MLLAGHFNERPVLESKFFDRESGNDVPDYTL